LAVSAVPASMPLFRVAVCSNGMLVMSAILLYREVATRE
jgi:hypothetical protein